MNFPGHENSPVIIWYCDNFKTVFLKHLEFSHLPSTVGSIVWQGWYGKYGVLTPFLFGPSHTQIVVSLGDKTDQTLLHDRQTETWQRETGGQSGLLLQSALKNYLTARSCTNYKRWWGLCHWVAPRPLFISAALAGFGRLHRRHKHKHEPVPVWEGKWVHAGFCPPFVTLATCLGAGGYAADGRSMGAEKKGRGKKPRKERQQRKYGVRKWI